MEENEEAFTVVKGYFYVSDVTTANKLKPEDRAQFWDAYTNYIAFGKEPENLSWVVDLLFESMRPHLDAQRKAKETMAGSLIGNQNAKKGNTCRKCSHYSSCRKEGNLQDEVCEEFEPSKSLVDNSNNEAPQKCEIVENSTQNGEETTKRNKTKQNLYGYVYDYGYGYDDDCSVAKGSLVENSEDAVSEDKESSSSSSSIPSENDNPEDIQTVEDWQKAKGIKKAKKDEKTINRIKQFLHSKGYSISYLDFLYEELLHKYGKDQITMPLIIPIMNWQDKQDAYKAEIQGKTVDDGNASKSTGHICPKCGGILYATSPNVWACYLCRKEWQLKAGGEDGELEESTA